MFSNGNSGNSNQGMNFMSFINSLRNVQMNPEKQQALDALKRYFQTGDSSECEALADRICQQHGMTRDQAVNQAKGFFNMR